MVDNVQNEENGLIHSLNIKEMEMFHEVRFAPSRVTFNRMIALQFSAIPKDYAETKWDMAEDYADFFRKRLFFWRGRNIPVTREEISDFLAESGDFFLSRPQFEGWVLAGVRFVPQGTTGRIEDNFFSDVNVNAWLCAMRDAAKAVREQAA